VQACLDFPHAHGVRRVYPHSVELSSEHQTALEAATSEVDQLSEWLQRADELPDHVEGWLCEIEADIERLEAKRHAYAEITHLFLCQALRTKNPRTDTAGGASVVNDGEEASAVSSSV
jgi:hypothetical protein